MDKKEQLSLPKFTAGTKVRRIESEWNLKQGDSGKTNYIAEEVVRKHSRIGNGNLRSYVKFRGQHDAFCVVEENYLAYDYENPCQDKIHKSGHVEMKHNYPEKDVYLK